MKIISVIIAAFHAAEFVKKAANSVLAQHLPEGYRLQLILGIDGCDATAKAAAGVVDERLQVIVMDGNYGTYITFNTMMQFALGELIVRFDADDVMLDGFLYKQIDVFEQRPEVWLTWTRSRYIDRYDTAIPDPARDASIPLEDWEIRSAADGQFMIRRELWMALGGFKPWRCNADTDFLIRMKFLGHPEWGINEVLYLRRIHPDSLTQCAATGYDSELRRTIRDTMEREKRALTSAEHCRVEPVVGKTRSIISPAERIRLEQLTNFVLNVSPAGSAGKARIPSSYYVPVSYWKEEHAIFPELRHSKIGIYQRLITHYGLNLYCAACRQLALLVTGHTAANEAIDAHTRVLLTGSTGETTSIRAWSDEPGDWRYGDETAKMNSDDRGGYFFGMISDRYLLTDPLDQQTHFPAALGGDRLEWAFYDPFLGENTWATLIAPLQIHFHKQAVARIPAAGYSDELQLALSILPALQAMQSSTGGVYARPAPFGQPMERLISNETNLTLYAGLSMLRELLPEGSATGAIDALLGGLRAYFRHYLFGHSQNNWRMHTCGTFENGEFKPGLAANGEAARFAVDVHTWGMSILGVEEIDGQHGPGTCFALWQEVKAQAGYYPPEQPGSICGVGYSPDPQGRPLHHICSPEWTFGAINMCRILAAEYEAPGPHFAPHLARELRNDEQTMLTGVRAFESPSALNPDSRSYPYVNTLCDTGFGWHAFPVESLCATAWALLVQKNFNPFRLGGAYLSIAHPAPPAAFTQLSKK